MNVDAPDVYNINLVLFSHEAALTTRYEYLEYLPDGDQSNGMDAGHVTWSMPTLAKWDAFEATTVSYVPGDSRSRIGVTDKSFITTHLSHFFF